MGEFKENVVGICPEWSQKDFLPQGRGQHVLILLFAALEKSAVALVWLCVAPDTRVVESTKPRETAINLHPVAHHLWWTA